MRRNHKIHKRKKLNEPKGKGELEEKKSKKHLSGFYLLLHHP